MKRDRVHEPTSSDSFLAVSFPRLPGRPLGNKERDQDHEICAGLVIPAEYSSDLGTAKESFPISRSLMFLSALGATKFLIYSFFSIHKSEYFL